MKSPDGKPESKMHTPTEHLAKTPKEAVIVALAAGFSTLICPTLGIIRNSGEVCAGYKVDILLFFARLMPVALIAVGLGVLLARRAQKNLALVLGGILLAVLAVLNLFIMIGPAGC